MKKFNKNILVFVICGIFVLFGFAGHLFDIKGTITMLYEEKEALLQSHDVKTTLKRLSDNDLWYHDTMVDINSMRLYLLNNRVVKKTDELKGDEYLVKTESGKISYYTAENDKEAVMNKVSEIKKIYQYAVSSDSRFLYVTVPLKQMFEQFPPNITDYSALDYSDLTDSLSENGIPYLDSKTALLSDPVSEEEIFFNTDHHWKPYSGFVVAKSISEKLNELYTFSYDSQYTDIENYDVETYEKSFLGSLGKKAGQYFSWGSVDDFDLITPKFATDFTESIPSRNVNRKGTFKETLLHMEYMNGDFYHGDMYSIYSGGNNRLQIIKNNQLKDGKKFVIIRTSYAGVVTPYLALQASELHLIDNRDMKSLTGSHIDIENYIREIRPDYVLMIE